MAVTIITQPAAHTPCFNNQYFVVSSNNTSQTNFKYVFKTYCNTSSGDELLSTVKLSKRPENNWAYFNPQKSVESRITNEFYPNLTDFQFSFGYALQKTGAIKNIKVVCEEEYGSPVSGFSGVTGSYHVWNGAYDAIDFANFTYSAGALVKDLTLSPSLTDTISRSQQALMKSWHRGFSTGAADLFYLIIDSYTSSGAQIQQVIFENAWWNETLNFGNYYIIFNASVPAINAFSGTVFSKSDPSTDNVPNGTAYYTMQWTNSSAAVTSNTHTVYLDDFCSKYERYVLHFLNKLGNYDSFTFNMVSRYKSENESQNYKKIPYELNASNKYTYTDETKDTITYATTITNSRTLISDWITEAQSEWLRDLFMSPDIRLEIDGTYYAVTCKEKNYETKIKAQDKLINITIEVDFNLQDVRQRG